MDNALIDPLTGIEYSLLHLHGFNTKYEIRDGQETVLVDIRVHFSTHCYTKSREDNDPDHVVLYRERKRDGSIDERVFCERRWNFSQRLPGIIQDLHSKLCHEGGSGELFYRQEDASQVGAHDGWYICIRMNVSDRHQNLVMSVRSAHHRHNRPCDIRGGTRRFYALLSRYYRKVRQSRDWLK